MASGFNISNFRSSINNDGLIRDNSFLMMITPPPALKSFSNDALTLRCDSINVPGLNLQTQDGIYRYGYGPADKYPYTANYQEVRMTFVSDKKAKQYTFFNIWQNIIFNNNDISGGILGQTGSEIYPFEMGYRSDYATTVNIFVYNESMDKVIEVTLMEAWPRMVEDTPLAWEGNSYVRFVINFSYASMFTKTIASSDPSRNTFNTLYNATQQAFPSINSFSLV